jgi:hypothetical protein
MCHHDLRDATLAAHSRGCASGNALAPANRGNKSSCSLCVKYWKVFSKLWPRISNDAALHIEKASIISIVSTALEFDEKKFWIPLFSMMARREAAKTNATSQPFVPFVASCAEWYNSEPIAKKGESADAAMANDYRCPGLCQSISTGH